eukprot:3008027-Pyramimonas_sp.AAC.2
MTRVGKTCPTLEQQSLRLSGSRSQRRRNFGGSELRRDRKELVEGGACFTNSVIWDTGQVNM